MELKCGTRAKWWRGLTLLLIVPYGIEIEKNKAIDNKATTFNRTLWN